MDVWTGTPKLRIHRLFYINAHTLRWGSLFLSLTFSLIPSPILPSRRIVGPLSLTPTQPILPIQERRRRDDRTGAMADPPPPPQSPLGTDTPEQLLITHSS